MAVAVSPGIPKKKHNRRLAVFMLLNIVIQYNKTRALQNASFTTALKVYVYENTETKRQVHVG